MLFIPQPCLSFQGRQNFFSPSSFYGAAAPQQRQVVPCMKSPTTFHLPGFGGVEQRADPGPGVRGGLIQQGKKPPRLSQNGVPNPHTTNPHSPTIWVFSLHFSDISQRVFSCVTFLEEGCLVSSKSLLIPQVFILLQLTPNTPGCTSQSTSWSTSIPRVVFKIQSMDKKNCEGMIQLFIPCGYGNLETL